MPDANSVMFLACQVLALFSKAIRKLHAFLRATKQAAVERTLPAVKPIMLLPHATALDDDLDDAAAEVGPDKISLRTLL